MNYWIKLKIFLNFQMIDLDLLQRLILFQDYSFLSFLYKFHQKLSFLSPYLPFFSKPKIFYFFFINFLDINVSILIYNAFYLNLYFGFYHKKLFEKIFQFFLFINEFFFFR